MIEFSALPHDRRNFVHRRILGAGKAFVTSGFNPLSAAGAFVAPRQSARGTIPRSATARPTAFSAAQQEEGRRLKFPLESSGAGRSFTAAVPKFLGRCVWPSRPHPVTGNCQVFLGDRPGRDTEALQVGPGLGVGEAVMGRYGAALEPGSRIIDRAVCLRGMQLGNDGLCYNKGSIKNSDRMWPRGRRPLLTGGEMRAISIASRAAGRLTRTAVRLQEIGLIKKPVVRKRLKKKS